MLPDNIKAPFGVIDMGSNGIRFGIIQSLKRHLPVTYEERAPISLLEAQGTDKTIPAETINQVVTSFKRFQTICQFEGIDPLNIQVIATEATRIASNSTQFLEQIHKSTGLTVSILSKEQEAVISSMGIAGSFYKINGLTMDLGGGSVELNYITSSHRTDNPRKRLKTSPNPVSLPYGAVVMKNKLAACAGDPSKLEELESEIIEQFKKAKDTTRIPDDLQYTVYMSGGGFRALGYLSMAEKDQPQEKGPSMPITPVSPTLYIDTVKTAAKEKKTTYPIPIITGYSMTGDQLKELVDKFKHCDPEDLVSELKAFRISKRRTKMLPATCFLVSAMLKVIPINKVYFSEGGLRQGLCYHLLPPSEREKDPLLEGIQDYIEPMRYKLPTKEYQSILNVIGNAIPLEYLDSQHPFQLHRLVPAALLLANMTSHYPKETRAYVAFHMPLASGPLANVAGLLHSERALLALLLAYRQGGEVPDDLLQVIESRVGKEAVSVCRYIGKLMEFIFMLSPRLPSLGLVTTGVQFRLKKGETPDCAHVLQVVVPEKKENSLLDAPGVMALVKSMNKKIQIKKWKEPQQEQAMFESNCNSKKLFTIEICHE